MFSLIRSVYRYTDISGLFRSQLRQFHPDLFEMQASYFFIQVLRQAVGYRFKRWGQDTNGVLVLRQAVYIYFVFLVEQLDLSQCLIGK